MNDRQIINIAQQEHFIIVSKDKDFLNNFLVHGHPPDILLISVGNMSNPKLTRILTDNFASIEKAFQSGAHLVVMEPERLVVW